MDPRNLLEKLLRREDLTPDETRALFDCLTGDTPPELKSGLLVALRAKGESVAEIAGMATEMRARAVRLPDRMRQALDTCGTGGDGSRSLNISTLSALTLASMGVPVVKHGNRAASSSCGSADLLEALGLPMDLTPQASAELFEKTRFAFLFAPLYHPSMKAVVPVRKALQVRTIFNFLGPLANPAQVSHQIVGVPEESRVRPFTEVLRKLGLGSAMVVHGRTADKGHGDKALDEISPCGQTRVSYFLKGGDIREETWTPAMLGIQPIEIQELAVADVQESKTRGRAVLAGKGAPADETAVAVNAAAGLYIYGEAKDISEAVRQVRKHLSTGNPARHLEAIIKAAKH